MELNQDKSFVYSCFLVKLSRQLNPEQVQQFKEWLIATTNYEIQFSRLQLSQMDKYSVLEIFDILKRKGLIDLWCNNIIEDFLKDSNLAHLCTYHIQSQPKRMEQPSPVEAVYPGHESPRYPLQYPMHNGFYRYSLPEFGGIPHSTPTSPPNHTYNPIEMNLQKNVYSNENKYHAELNGGAMTINNTTYNGPIHLIKTCTSSPESKSPVDEPEEVHSPISPEFIDTIASEIGREWKTVARKGFKLEEGRIDEIEYDSRRLKDQVVRMITLWKSLTEDCSQLALANALCRSNLRGIVKGNFPTAVSRIALS